MSSHIWNQLWLYKEEGGNRRPQRSVFYLVCSGAFEVPLEPPRVCVCFQVFTTFPVPPPTHCTIPRHWNLAWKSVLRKGNRGLREQLDWGGQHPQVQAFRATACVLFLAHLGQIRIGSAFASHGKGLCGRFPTHLLPIMWTLGQARGRQKGKGSGWGGGWGEDDRQVAAAMALRPWELTADSETLWMPGTRE